MLLSSINIQLQCIERSVAHRRAIKAIKRGWLIILYDSFLRSFSQYSVYYLYNNRTSSIHETHPWDRDNKPFSSTPASPINKSVAYIKQRKNHLNHTLAVTRSISFQTIPAYKQAYKHTTILGQRILPFGCVPWWKELALTMATSNAYVNGILNVREQLQKCWVADLDWSLLPENVGKVRNATTHAVT